jgi:hypothetical protein
MSIGAIRAKLFLHISSEHMNLNFKQKKVACLKTNYGNTTFLFFYFFMFYSKIIEKITLL